MPRKSKILRKLFICFTIIVLGVVLLSVTFYFLTKLNPPVSAENALKNKHRIVKGKDFYVYGNNWLKRSNSGLWEMYIEGKPLERGIANGLLAKDLCLCTSRHGPNLV